MTTQHQEVMDILQEECAEVIQAISKVRRFGIDEIHLKNGHSNRVHLTEEVGDLLCMIQLMMETGILIEKEVYDAAFQKRAKLQQWSNILTV